MRRLVVAFAGVVLLSACGQGSPGTPSAATPSTGVTVASYFAAPEPYPGSPWTKDGRAVDPDELNTIAGPDHCEWQSAVMLHLGWPLGAVAESSDEIRQYVRDPRGLFGGRLSGTLEVDADLPADARDSGYRSGDVALWLADSEPDAAYLRAGDNVERWPRANQVIACR